MKFIIKVFILLNIIGLLFVIISLPIMSVHVIAEGLIDDVIATDELNNVESSIQNKNISEWSDKVPLIGIFVTLAISAFTLFFQLINNNRNRYVNAITTERVRWIGELKELLSEYLSLTTYYEKRHLLIGETLETRFERLIYLKNKIKLHLNYIDKQDQKIIDLIEKINEKTFGIYLVKDILELPIKERFNAVSYEIKQQNIEKVIKEIGKEKAKTFFMTGNHEILLEIIDKFSDELDKDFKDQYGYKGRNDLIDYTNKLVEYSRIYLKEEWEKVKKEAEIGKVTKK